ncbi:hypothetical protein CDAR_179231 [Caerostris darwini]|uniref:Uncharacterized protein n=1 Tax=Caerostris darwini TaxID=1538125 RepID=A0AAV4PFJ3_9ARAC|nr:hypothetical protein CDAR_179231 [Caerostris darwini]
MRKMELETILPETMETSYKPGLHCCHHSSTVVRRLVCSLVSPFLFRHFLSTHGLTSGEWRVDSQATMTAVKVISWVLRVDFAAYELGRRPLLFQLQCY